MKKLFVAMTISVAAISNANALSFVNGGFEDGTTSGWALGSGSNSLNGTGTMSGELALDPADYIGNTSNWQGTVTNAGEVDSITGLSKVRYGNHAVRVNNNVNDFSVNAIQQRVTAYDGTSINFAWAAVLENSHGITDSDIFGLQILDETTNTVLYNSTYSSANTPSFFSPAGNWYYNDWEEVSLNVTQGHDFLVSLLAADCPYGAHAGYVYLDGFGTVFGGGGDNGSGGGSGDGGSTSVPEPVSMALLVMGLGALGARRRMKA